jgi:hypothetical protein
VSEEEGEGHANAPELAIVVGVAAEGGEVLDAASCTVAPRELQGDARATRRALFGGVALAGSVCVGDVVVVRDLGQLALPKGQGLALLPVGALACAPVWGGSEKGWVRGVVGVARCLPARRGVSVPVGD